MDIFQFTEQFSSTEHTIAYTRNRSLLRQIPPSCGRNGCERRMTQVKNKTFVFDGCQWRCTSHKGNKVSIRENSFFANAHFPLRKGMFLAYCWALSIFPLIFLNIFIIETGIPLHTQKQMIRLQIEALVNWNKFFRDICSRWLLDHPIRFL